MRPSECILLIVSLTFASSIFMTSLPAAEPTPEKPKMSEDAPAPGKFVKITAPEYANTGVYHMLYLPTDWQKDKLYPVIVEYAGNQSPPICTGRVEDCQLGYYLSGGSGFIWIVLPYVNEKEKKNQLTWWGDEDATVKYAKTQIKRVCETYGGDTSAIFVTGFSRGAIACGYIALRDEMLADAWLAFIPHSHLDAGTFTAKGGKERLARVAGRATFITYGEQDNGKNNSLNGKKILEEFKFPVVAYGIPKLDHTDRWIEQDCMERKAAREWIAKVLKERPGTRSVSGKVVDAAGKPLSGAKVQSGELHWTVTDEKGEYTLRSLVNKEREISVTKAGYTFSPERRQVTLTEGDVRDLSFTGAGP